MLTIVTLLLFLVEHTCIILITLKLHWFDKLTEMTFFN
jgi:hypothetical protein